MRILLQRVLSASVEIDQKIAGAIKSGVLKQAIHKKTQIGWLKKYTHFEFLAIMKGK